MIEAALEQSDTLSKDGDDSSLNSNTMIESPESKQCRNIDGKAVSLSPDYISTNISDSSSTEPAALQCTSCKSAEPAISRCHDCATFLCVNCDDAHKRMRCFENHQVSALENLRNSDETVAAIHKPIHCAMHTGGSLEYYCFKCQVPICKDCVVGEHQDIEHHCEYIGKAAKLARSEIEDLMAQANSLNNYCGDALATLRNALSELQSQRVTAHNLIVNTFERCSKKLDKCRELSLKELDRLHSERELQISNQLHTVEKCVESIGTACPFTNKMLQSANASELLVMKKQIGSQLCALTMNRPTINTNFSLEFDSGVEQFEQLATVTFGKLRTESTPRTHAGLLPTSYESNIPWDNRRSASTGSLQLGKASSMISLPTSMQSSIDAEFGGGANFLMNAMALAPDAQRSTQTNRIQPNGSTAQSTENQNDNQTLLLNTSMAEYNLLRLAKLAESTEIIEGIEQIQLQPSPVPSLDGYISHGQEFNNNLQVLYDIDRFNSTEMTTNNMLTHRMDTPSLLAGVPMSSSSSSINTIASMNDVNMNVLNHLNIGDPGMNRSSGTGSMAGLKSNGNAVAVKGRTNSTPMYVQYNFGSLGSSTGKFNSPHGFCLGANEEIIVADTNNHRIQNFERDGTFRMAFGRPGKQNGHLWYPRKVAVNRSNDKIVVCDRGNERSRMQIFTKYGEFIQKVTIRYVDIVAGLAITNEGHIVVVDSVSPAVFVISEDSDIIRWFNCSGFVCEPSDIAISGNDFYLSDFKGHCVAVFGPNGAFKYRIGNEKVTPFPNGIDISDNGDILVGDSHGNRFHVACFTRDGILQAEFECPSVKVSRCCGLKITSEGRVVTLAKNNHHALVLNSLYIP